MEYILYLKPQFVDSKKPKQYRVKSRKNNFVETYSLNLLKSLILQFLKIFLFFYVFHYITKLQTEIQDRQKTFRREGAETFRKDLTL